MFTACRIDDRLGGAIPPPIRKFGITEFVYIYSDLLTQMEHAHPEGRYNLKPLYTTGASG